jgi:hypothetical protein
MRFLLALAVVALLVPIRSARAGDACVEDCLGEVACEVRVTDCLFRMERARDAIKRLKDLVRANPEQTFYSRLLARAYLKDNNPFWAQRTLQKNLALDPADCESRSWLAWVHISNGNLTLAREVLAGEGCPGAAPDRCRWLILQGFMAQSENDPAVATLALQAVQEQDEMYAEDLRAWRIMRAAADPGFISPLEIRMDLWAGYTSNAEAGSPTDSSTSGIGSAFGRLDLFSRFVYPLDGFVRPTVEGSLKGHGIYEESARKLSYLEMSVRPGLVFGRGFPRATLGYKADLLLINHDEKSPFYEGHRLELEVETKGPLVFAGFGKRLFRESGRSRWEVDGGIGGGVTLHERVQLLLAGSFRIYVANSEQYNLVGGTALAVMRVGVGLGIQLRIGLSVGFDEYLDSGGDRGLIAFGTRKQRIDVLTKPSVEVWSPSFGGFRAGFGYEFAWRNSTADGIPDYANVEDKYKHADDYGYLEHRALFKVRWAFDLNPWAPREVKPLDHVALDYGLEGSQGSGPDQERIQDLLRQDEAARRGSSCVD